MARSSAAEGASSTVASGTANDGGNAGIRDRPGTVNGTGGTSGAEPSRREPDDDAPNDPSGGTAGEDRFDDDAPDDTDDDVVDDDVPGDDTADDEVAEDAGGVEPNPVADGGMSDDDPGPFETPGTPVEETRADTLVPRGEHGVAALADEVYVLCGFTPAVTSSMQVYSPEQDSWRQAADVPVDCHHPNVAVVDGRLYLLGFHGGSGQRMADGRTFAYDPLEDSWTERASLPPGTERGASCVTTFEDKVYLFGGTNDVALPDASVYDPAENSWTMLPPLPALRHHCIAAEVNGLIYIVSGRDVVIEEVQAESYVYDPVAQRYEEVAPIPTPRGGAAGGLLNGRIYVFGGEGNPNDPMRIFHEAEAYDPTTDTWSALPDMVVPRHGFGAAVIGDRMYLPGGSISQGIDVQTTHSVFFLEAP